MKSTQKLNPRYFVPDLSPEARPALRTVAPRFVFVAESPHVSEVEPERVSERRPLCGAAGKQWWSLLHEVFEGKPNTDVSLENLLSFCKRHRMMVMNSVQYPLDPKITRVYPEANPEKVLGFSKGPGEASFKRRKKSEQMQKACESLKNRLLSPELKGCEIIALGNDAEWFLTQALSPEELEKRYFGKIPHPSAWWRKGGYFGRVAKEKLLKISGA